MYRTDPRQFTPEQLDSLRRPRNAEACEMIVSVDGTVYAYQQAGKLLAVAYIGKGLKSAFHFVFRTAEQRDARIKEFFAGRQAHQDLMASRRADSTQAHSIKAGEIVVNSWGWEQTNIDFYVVTKTSKNFVWLQPIKAHAEETGFMSGKTTPVLPPSPCGEVTMHRVSIWTGGASINFKHGGGSVWDGKAEAYSCYA